MIGKKEQFNQNMVVSLIVVFLVILSFQTASAETSMEQHRRGRRTYAKIPKLTGPQVAFLINQGKILIVDAKNPNRFKERNQQFFREFWAS